MDPQGVVIADQRAVEDADPRSAGWPARLWAWLRPRQRWCLGTRLVVLATAAWLGFVGAHWLLSGRTSLWAPFDLTPPFLFLAIPLLLALVAPFARPVRWRIMAVLALTAAAGAPLSGLNLATLWHTPPPASPAAITVLSWNPEFWDQDWRGGDGSTVHADFYDYLRSFDADVYLLKEYLHASWDGEVGNWDAEMAIRIDEEDRLREEFPGYEIVSAGEQITLSRLPMVSHRGLDVTPWLPPQWREVPPELYDFPDSYTVETLRTDLRVGDTVVSFYNAHIHQPPMEWQLFRSEARGANEYNHVRRQASFQALRADVEANSHPVVIGADLNTTPAMGVRRLLPSGLEDPTPALSSLYPTSWMADGIRLWRIDWMFTTPDLTVHEYEFPDVGGRSDHLPQWMVLSVDQ